MQRLNIREVITQLGGAHALSKQLGVTSAAVYDWGRDNSLPLRRAIEVSAMLGIDRDLLHDPWRGYGQEIMSAEDTQRFLGSNTYALDVD